MNDSPLIEARGLGVLYGRKRAVDDVSFAVAKGRVVGLLGHNGAGKTSLMKALVGLAPCTGSLSVLGLRPRHDRVRLLESLCYIPDVAILPRWARVHQLIRLMQGLHPRFSAARAESLLARTSVGLDDKVKTLSKGMVVQLHLALIAAIDARVMVLDEPTLGLDVMAARAIVQFVRQCRDRGKTVIYSTHVMSEIDKLCDTVGILHEGRLLVEGTLQQLRAQFGETDTEEIFVRAVTNGGRAEA